MQRTYKIYRDGFKKDEKARCAVITSNQKLRKRPKPQITVDSAEKEAIIKAIYVTQRTGERRVIITDSLSTLMAVEGYINSLWVPGHMGIPRNVIADEKAKAALENDL
jgi:ribonuclease HI